MPIELLLTLIATVLTIIAYIEYLKDTIAGKTRPHIFSFFLWTLTTGIIFFLQLKNNGGIGSWATLLVTLVLFFVFLLSLKKGKRDISKIDWFLLFIALISIPIWLYAKQPVLSAILLASIDSFAYIMTFRKSWHSPWSETISMWTITAIRDLIILFALTEISIITSSSLFVGVFFNGIGALYLVWRRMRIKRANNEGERHLLRC